MGLFTAILAAAGIYTVVLRTKIRRTGAEAEAVVARVESSDRVSDVGTVTRYSNYIVTYLDETGSPAEASIANPRRGLKEGTRCRIKYDPSKPGYAILIEIL